MKSKFNRLLLAGFVTVFFLTGVMLSCNGSSGSDSSSSGPATIPAVVFIADKDVDGVNELYAALNDGDSVVKLSGSIPPGFDVIDFKISPDGSRVAFRVGQVLPPVDIELYVNNINGGIPVKVSDPLVAGGNVEVPFSLTFDAFNWSPDSSMIAYIADQESDGVYELFISAPDGSSNLKVSGAMHTVLDGGDVLEFEWAPDSSLIVYRADQDFNGVIELYASQPSVTSTFTKINIPIPDLDPRDVDVIPGTNEDVFEWAPDSSLIAYIADQDSNDVFELFTAKRNIALPTVFDPPVQVSFEPLVPSGDVLEFSWAPDGSRIAYRADRGNSTVFELYTVEPAGANNVKVSGAMHTVLDGGDVLEFEWAPDSSLIASFFQ